jgi:hypothetical protein
MIRPMPDGRWIRRAPASVLLSATGSLAPELLPGEHDVQNTNTPASANSNRAAQIEAQFSASMLETTSVWHLAEEPADIICVDENGQVVGRPWLSVAIDPSTQAVTAFATTLNKPDNHLLAEAILQRAGKTNIGPTEMKGG